jgi:hypothetical protein
MHTTPRRATGSDAPGICRFARNSIIFAISSTVHGRLILRCSSIIPRSWRPNSHNNARAGITSEQTRRESTS